jgi:serine/threonine protein kinase
MLLHRDHHHFLDMDLLFLPQPPLPANCPSSLSLLRRCSVFLVALPLGSGFWCVSSVPNQTVCDADHPAQHDKSILHLDLKPGNVLLTWDEVTLIYACSCLLFVILTAWQPTCDALRLWYLPRHDANAAREEWQHRNVSSSTTIR